MPLKKNGKKQKRRNMKIKNNKKALVAVCAAIVATIAVCAYMSSDKNVTVLIKGNVKSVNYTGSLQSSIGYTVEIDSPNYTTDDFVCYATDSVSATNVGTYAMGIDSRDFQNVNPKFNNVKFVVVEDGSLKINKNEVVNSKLTANK